MATLRELRLAEANENQKIGTIESILAGVGSGLLAIPKGFFFIRCNIIRSRCGSEQSGQSRSIL